MKVIWKWQALKSFSISSYFDHMTSTTFWNGKRNYSALQYKRNSNVSDRILVFTNICKRLAPRCCTIFHNLSCSRFIYPPNISTPHTHTHTQTHARSNVFSAFTLHEIPFTKIEIEISKYFPFQTRKQREKNQSLRILLWCHFISR